MKKKFLKKLSFVLAFAMIISVVAPAAGVFAASGLKLNSTNKYLHLDVEDKDEYNFNFTAGKKKGYNYFWYSTEEDVATVNEKNGVTTAVGAGKTTIFCEVTDADDEYVDTVKATVTVRDNIETVKISNAPTEDIAVGEAYDFNRSYVTMAGNTKGSESVTRWTVDPADKATINDKGVFVASESGDYKITAWSFQSKARYNSWKKDAAANAGEVLDSDTIVVTVGASMVEAKQKNLSKVDVKFSSPMTKDEVKENIYINYMIGDVNIKEQKIKKDDIKMSSDGLTATVEIYDTFVPKATYKVTYTDMDPKTFVAATTNPDDVVDIDITTTTAKVYTDTEVKFNLLDKNGVAINQPTDVSNLNSRVDLVSDNEYTSLLNKMLMIFKEGDTTLVTATYHTYDYDGNGNETVYKDAQNVIGVVDGDLKAQEMLAWTIVKGGAKPNFDKVTQFIAAGDFGRQLYVQLKLSNDKKVSNFDAAYTNKIKLTSSDSSVLFVDETGYLVPVKAGTVRVTVQFDDSENFAAGTNTYVGSFNVEVKPERKAARLSVDKALYTNVSNSKGFDGLWSDKQTIKVNLLDQYTDKLVDNVSYAPNLYVRPLSVKAKDSFGTQDILFSSIFVDSKFSPAGLPEGKYQFLIYDGAYPSITGQVTFDVKTPVEALTPASWKVELTGLDKNGNVDVVVKTDADANKTFGVELMAFARNGIKIGPDNLANYNVRIKDTKGKDIVAEAKTVADNSLYNSTWTVSGSAVSGGAIEKLETGKYTIDVLDVNTVKARGIFNVVDTQNKPVVKPLSFRSDYTEGALAFDECFKVTIKDGVVLGVTAEFEKTTVPTRAFVKKVFVQQEIGVNGLYIEHEVNVGYYITVPVNFDGYMN